MDKNTYDQYIKWRDVKKAGKRTYYINNVVTTGLFSTAFFAVALGLINLFIKNSVLGFLNIIIYSVFFLIIYTGVLFVIYYIGWKKNSEKFEKFEKKLKNKLYEKIENGELNEEQIKNGNAYDLLNENTEDTTTI